MDDDLIPGEWKLVPAMTPYSAPTIESDTRRLIAVIYGTAADARVMAAAKELLAACELWDRGFVEGEQFDAEQFRRWVNDNRRAARAAIAKARGT